MLFNAVTVIWNNAFRPSNVKRIELKKKKKNRVYLIINLVYF